jgi:hypothetical protein
MRLPVVLPRACLVALLALVALSPRTAWGHGVRTGALRIDQVSETRALVRWSTTVPDAAIGVDLPPACIAASQDEAAGAGVRVWALQCPGGLRGQAFAVRGLGAVLDDATLFARFAGGQTASRLLTPSSPSFSLPATQTATEVAASYVRSGVLHIASGADHLLLLVLLVLLLRRARAVLLAETAFTLSHSVAFSVTALGWVHVPAAPAEACIALSLVLLALDVRAAPMTDVRRGALAALVFGVVHGLGFAGGLSETGLPDAHVAVALIGFGAGVELGQVAFLVGILGLVALASRARAFPRLATGAATAIGGVATAWLIERLLVSWTV